MQHSELNIVAWAKHGIVGRGVLLDYVSYVKRHNIRYDPLDHHAVTLNVAKSIAKDCNFEFQAGDIVLLRTGKCHIFSWGWTLISY